MCLFGGGGSSIDFDSTFVKTPKLVQNSQLFIDKQQASEFHWALSIQQEI